MPDVLNQHFVPQFYLKKFTHNGEQLFVFDKFGKRSFETHVRNIASERRFYDIHPDMVSRAASQGLRIDPQTVETTLSELEGEFSRALENTLHTIDEQQAIRRDQKEAMACFMAVQLLRTPEFRRAFLEMMDGLANRLLEMMPDPAIPKDEYRVEWDRSRASLDHASLLLDYEMLDAYVKALSKHIWTIGINETTLPFYTSDNPIVSRAHYHHSFKSYAGIASPGIQIVFPLSPRYIFILWERTAFEDFEILDYHSIPIQKRDSVKSLNGLQVLQSYRQVYCSSNEFDFAELLCKEYPEACTPNRKRIMIS